MIDIPTLLIIGAGGSNPYGYPTGPQLRAQIITGFYEQFDRLLKKDPAITAFDKERHLREAKAFVDVFRDSSVESIDKFLALNPFYSYYGKIAITLSILRSEQSSNFHDHAATGLQGQNWYKLLFNRMISSFKNPDDYKYFKENKLAFITFNYDRSFEYFLYSRFLNAFSGIQEEFELSINKNDFIPFPVVHVYGKVDKLPWHGGREYRENFDFQTILKLSQGIRIIGERAKDLKEEVETIISGVKRIFFLGFGYAKENLEAIGFPGIINEDWQIFGTAKGMTKREIEMVRNVFTTNFHVKGLNNPYIEDKTSYELLREYL